jgi:hypothetical protein
MASGAAPSDLRRSFERKKDGRVNPEITRLLAHSAPMAVEDVA